MSNKANCFETFHYEYGQTTKIFLCTNICGPIRTENKMPVRSIDPPRVYYL